MKLKDQLLEHPEIPAIRARYEAADRNFDTAMHTALNIAQSDGPKDSRVIIRIAINLLNEWLREKPATTKGGRIIRFIVGIANAVAKWWGK